MNEKRDKAPLCGDTHKGAFGAPDPPERDRAAMLEGRLKKAKEKAREKSREQKGNLPDSGREKMKKNSAQSGLEKNAGRLIGGSMPALFTAPQAALRRWQGKYIRQRVWLRIFQGFFLSLSVR